MKDNAGAALLVSIMKLRFAMNKNTGLAQTRQGVPTCSPIPQADSHTVHLDLLRQEILEIVGSAAYRESRASSRSFLKLFLYCSLSHMLQMGLVLITCSLEPLVSGDLRETLQNDAGEVGHTSEQKL